MADEDGLRSWVIELPYARPPLSANRREHWSPAHKEYRQVRDDMIVLGRRAIRNGLAEVGRCNILLTWYLGSDRIADADNPTDTIKPLLDGLVQAGVWPDDHWRYVRMVACRVVPRSEDSEPGARPRMTLTIREVSRADSGPGDSDERPRRRSGARPQQRYGQGFPDSARQSVLVERYRRSVADGPRRY